MKDIRCWPLVLGCLIVFLFGCASFAHRQTPEAFGRPEDCRRLFNQLDEKVLEAGVRDASNHPIPGFPYLRTNRFLSALKDRVREEREKEQWVRWMQELDLNAREKEISNLPDRLLPLFEPEGINRIARQRLYAEIGACSNKILENDAGRPDFYETLYPRVEVPDVYSFLMRTIGLYPVVAVPVALVTGSSRNKTRAWFETDLKDLTADGQLQAFVPAENVALAEKEIQGIIELSKGNPLKVPLHDRTDQVC